MALGVDVLELCVHLRRPSVVQHVPEMTIGDVVVLVPVRQGILWHLEHERDQREELLHGILGDVALEALDLLTVLLDDFRVRARQLRDEFEDVVHLDVVAEARENFDGAFGAVAGVVAMFEVGAVAQLFFYG